MKCLLESSNGYIIIYKQLEEFKFKLINGASQLGGEILVITNNRTLPGWVKCL